jgi:hypothetical protein
MRRGHSSTAKAGATSSINGQWLLRLKPKSSAMAASEPRVRPR